jgi:tetratricopeptide (TPR) repeat protein
VGSGEWWRGRLRVGSGDLDDALLGRGTGSYALGSYDDAIVDLSRLLRRNPNEVEAYFYRGLAYRAKALERRAGTDFASAHRLSPFDPVIRAEVERAR